VTSPWVERLRQQQARTRQQANAVQALRTTVPARPAQPTPRGHKERPEGSFEAEMARIVALPYRDPAGIRCPNPEQFHAELVNHVKQPDFKGLRDIQLHGAWEFKTLGGLFGPIGVGHGKAILAFLCARLAHVERGHRTVLILTGPEVLGQMVDKDLPTARRWLRMDDCAVYPVRGDKAKRMGILSSAYPGVYMMSYSTISTQTGYEELRALGATAYILDEAHKLASAKSARTKRFISAVKDIEAGLPEEHVGIECAVLSGTVTKKSVTDYAHLAHATLRNSSFVPTSGTAIQAYSSVIDADAMEHPSGRREFKNILDWGLRHGLTLPTGPCNLTVGEIFREAHRYRMITSPGVIATSDQSVDCSLIIQWQEPRVPPTPEGLRMINLMKDVVKLDQTPDGDELDWAMHRFKWLWELSGGFYNSLRWPDSEKIQRKHACTAAEADRLLAAAQYHHGLVRGYHKSLNNFLKGPHIPGCDTPLLVASCIKRLIDQADAYKGPHIPAHLVQAWADARNAHYPDLPERESVPVRVCRYKVDAAVAWAKENKEGIVWYHHPEVGTWLCERLTEEGMTHTYAPAGENEKVFNPGLVVASMAHGTGKNLQHQCRQLFLEIRREASIMEQILGRTHRAGQMADEVYADLLISTGFDLALFNACLSDADYIQSSMGTTMKLCYATYNPVIPPTNPRLLLKLGIIDKLTSAASVDAFDQITDDDAVAAMVRPVAYARDHVAAG
jgi:hypothetical protein